MNGWNKSVSDRENTSSRRRSLRLFFSSFHSGIADSIRSMLFLSRNSIFLLYFHSLSHFFKLEQTIVLLPIHPSFYSYLLTSFVGSPSSPIFLYTTFYLHAKNSNQREKSYPLSQSGKTSCESDLSLLYRSLTCRLLIRN